MKYEESSLITPKSLYKNNCKKRLQILEAICIKINNQR